MPNRPAFELDLSVIAQSRFAGILWGEMIGTLVNVGAVLTGSIIGLLVGMRLPERVTKIVFQGIGLFTLAIGFSMALKTRNFVLMVFAIILGSICGELIDIDRGLTAFGEWLKRKLRRQQGAEARATDDGPGNRQDRFAEGMVTAFLLFCMGSMTVLGAIEEGMGRPPNLLLAKSVLDGFASVALSAAMGLGVAFSVIPLLIYQGGLTFLAGSLHGAMSDVVVNEVTAVGGLLLIGLGINILDLKKLKVLNMLPALAFAGVLAWLFPR